MVLKIAIATEDGESISSHFGRAPYYRVLAVDNALILTDQRIEKPHHPSGDAQQHGHSHGDMFAPIDDCQVLICGGMGEPAYQKAKAAGLEVILMGGGILEAVQAYLNGLAVSDMRRIHQHHQH